MRFKVPQDVQREDQILWFLTLRQLIMLIVGFGLSYWIWSSLSKKYELHAVEIIFVWLPAAIAAAFAFLKIKGIPLLKFFLLLMEQFMFRPPRRYWILHGGEPFVSMTTSFTMKRKKKEKAPIVAKNVTSRKIRKLAAILDSKKPSLQKSHQK